MVRHSDHMGDQSDGSARDYMDSNPKVAKNIHKIYIAWVSNMRSNS
jgi:hypothetical protein